MENARRLFKGDRLFGCVGSFIRAYHVSDGFQWDAENADEAIQWIGNEAGPAIEVDMHLMEVPKEFFELFGDVAVYLEGDGVILRAARYGQVQSENHYDTAAVDEYIKSQETRLKELIERVAGGIVQDRMKAVEARVRDRVDTKKAKVVDDEEQDENEKADPASGEAKMESQQD